MIRIVPAKDQQVRVTWALPRHEPPGPVSVVGDFNDWTPGTTELRPRSNGKRTAAVVVPRGTTLRFRYLGPDGHWFDDEDATAHDGQGGLISV
ncbi:isoamylase [Lentzea sp. DG1S-22]|nr:MULTISPECIES: isoamylase [unclassified Lentzea]MCG8925080.1 isoamylase [Lentzea sp. CC55]WVH81992.1 isoamylase [Lentzea sp. DG1S-22]